MRTTRTLRLGALVAVLLVAVTACGSDDSGSDSSSSSSEAELEQTQWVLRDTADLPTNGVAVTAEFSGRSVNGSGGCNTYRAPFTTKGTSLTIGPEIVSTKIACEPRVATVESSYLDRLPRVRSYAIDDTTLDLKDADGSTLLSYEASDTDTAILGEWKVTGYYTGSAIQSVVGNVTLTAKFAGEEVSGDSGCNAFGGPFTTDGDAIKLGPFRSTLRACTQPAVQIQEQQYLTALGLARTFRVTGSKLELLRDGGTIAVTFER